VITLYNTDGSVGAARGAGIGCGFYRSEEEAFSGLEVTGSSEPDPHLAMIYDARYSEWLDILENHIYE